MSEYLHLTDTVPAAECVAVGFPHPDTHASDFVDAVRDCAADKIEQGCSIEQANWLIGIAIARVNYRPPAPPEPMSALVIQILDEILAE